jgi:hypothetical protein
VPVNLSSPIPRSRPRTRPRMWRTPPLRVFMSSRFTKKSLVNVSGRLVTDSWSSA